MHSPFSSQLAALATSVSRTSSVKEAQRAAYRTRASDKPKKVRPTCGQDRVLAVMKPYTIYSWGQLKTLSGLGAGFGAAIGCLVKKKRIDKTHEGGHPVFSLPC